MPKLIYPSPKYKDSYLEAVREYQAEGLEAYAELDVNELEAGIEAYTDRLRGESYGLNLPDGYVSHTTYWLIETDEYIGTVDIRHKLTEHLEKIGGHIGYQIRPSKRRMGYGEQILKLSLPKAKMLGLEKVLVTCDETNIGSKKIIEANGGKLEDIQEQGPDLPRKLRYWIDLSNLFGEVVVGQKALIYDNQGSILVIRRNPAVEWMGRKGGWDFPGGGIDYGEDPTESMLREIEEETNLEVADIKPILTKSYTTEKFAIMIGYTAKAVDANILKLSPEHDQYRWVSIEEALSLDLPELHQEIVLRFREEL